MKSYLKWVGGKAKVMNSLLGYFPEEMNNYLEPFVGSCSVYLSFVEDIYGDFDIEGKKPNAVYLNDFNRYLINAHYCVANNLEPLKKRLRLLQEEYVKSKDKRKLFETKRAEMNEIILSGKMDEDVLLASLFIFLNKTCFNGIWRVNKKGTFNVPWNQVETTKIFKSLLLEGCSREFKDVIFSNEDFEEFITERVERNDFVFLDPPYIPVSETSSFTQYTENKWEQEETNRLLKCLEYIDNSGAKFMLTNSHSKEIYKMFDKWNIRLIDVHRFVKPVKASNDEKRKKVKEIVVTNY